MLEIVYCEKVRGVEMDLDPKVSHQMAKEMGQRIEELDNAISLMRTLRDEMDELFLELFGESRQGMK
jgi:hypothetical protein